MGDKQSKNKRKLFFIGFINPPTQASQCFIAQGPASQMEVDECFLTEVF